MTALPASEVELWPINDHGEPIQPKPKRVRRPSKARPETSKPALNEPESGTFVPVRERCAACSAELHIPDTPWPEYFDAKWIFYGPDNKEVVTEERVYMGKDTTPLTDGKQCCCNSLFCHQAHLRGEKLQTFDEAYAEEGHKMVGNWPKKGL